MGFLDKLTIGDGSLKPELRERLEAEGVVIIDEGLRGSIRYDKFKAPGKRFNGKVTGERFGLGISEHRIVVCCRSGSVKLVDTEFGSPRLDKLTPEAEGEKLRLRVDYDGDPEAEAKRVSGQITIRATTPNATRIADELRSRIAAAASR